MAGLLHSCPNCGSVGKVHRSLPRNRREKALVLFLPVYGAYRCHKCNWRGWLPRGSTSATLRKLLIGFYSALALTLLAWAIVTIVQNWPSPQYEYPIPALNK